VCKVIIVMNSNPFRSSLIPSGFILTSGLTGDRRGGPPVLGPFTYAQYTTAGSYPVTVATCCATFHDTRIVQVPVQSIPTPEPATGSRTDWDGVVGVGDAKANAQRTATHPSPTWRAFLASHARDIVAVDFFLVPTLTYRLLFAFVVLRHHRRELLHLHVTDQPTAVWTVPANPRGLPKRDRAKISTPRSGCHLRRARHPLSGQHGNSRRDHRSQNTLAERVRRTGHRLHPPRVPRSRHHSERGPSRPRPTRLSRLLQHRTTSPIAPQQQSPPASRPAAVRWPDHRHSPGRRAPSLLPARRLITATATHPSLAPGSRGCRQQCGDPQSCLRFNSSCGPSHPGAAILPSA
jgi:hypothetical protein